MGSSGDPSGRVLAVLTGAGLSTDSGIPDYRGPDSPPRTPMTFQQFVGDPAYRRHYWARNHVGWAQVARARPNAGHPALVALEARGVVVGVITQNVHLLHEDAGARTVIGTTARFVVAARERCGGVLKPQIAKVDAGTPQTLTDLSRSPHPVRAR